MKKIYIEPDLEIITIKLTEDILSSSQETPFTETPTIPEPETFPTEETLPW